MRRSAALSGLALSVTFLVILIGVAIPRPVLAAVQWSLAVVEGVYIPDLTALNEALSDGLVEIGPRKSDARPASYAVIYQGNSPAMPEMGPKAPKFGLQLQADLNPRYALVFGGSVGVLESSTRDIRRFFVGFYIDSPRETRFSLTLNQLWFGVRRYLEIGQGTPSRPRPRLYGEAGILGITRASLSTNVWLHVFAPEEGFDFYKVTSTESDGKGYATYLGGGGEYFLRKNISLSLDLQYVFGAVQDIHFKQFFTVDPLEEGLIEPGDPVMVTNLRRGSRAPLVLSLDGWDLKGMIRFYF